MFKYVLIGQWSNKVGLQKQQVGQYFFTSHFPRYFLFARLYGFY